MSSLFTSNVQVALEYASLVGETAAENAEHRETPPPSLACSLCSLQPLSLHAEVVVVACAVMVILAVVLWQWWDVATT
jgi:hypothetical protein